MAHMFSEECAKGHALDNLLKRTARFLESSEESALIRSIFRAPLECSGTSEAAGFHKVRDPFQGGAS